MTGWNHVDARRGPGSAFTSHTERTMDVFWLALSAALAVAIPALATAWAQARIGAAAAASLAEKPELTTTVIIMIAIPETMVVLGFVVALTILLQGGGG